MRCQGCRSAIRDDETLADFVSRIANCRIADVWKFPVSSRDVSCATAFLAYHFCLACQTASTDNCINFDRNFRVHHMFRAARYFWQVRFAQFGYFRRTSTFWSRHTVWHHWFVMTSAGIQCSMLGNFDDVSETNETNEMSRRKVSLVRRDKRDSRQAELSPARVSVRGYSRAAATLLMIWQC
jgi:hypothetical protein